MKLKIFIITVCLFISSLSVYSQGVSSFTRVYDRLDYLEEETGDWVIVGTDMNIVVEFNYMNYSNRIHIYHNNISTIIYPDRNSTIDGEFQVYPGIDSDGDNVFIMFSDALGMLVVDIDERNTTMRFIESKKRNLTNPNELNNVKK